MQIHGFQRFAATVAQQVRVCYRCALKRQLSFTEGNFTTIEGAQQAIRNVNRSKFDGAFPPSLKHCPYHAVVSQAFG
jgi:hypothetical protein